MADKLLDESIETSGAWFLPEDPDRRVPGTILHTPERTELHLDEAFVQLHGAVRAGDSLQKYPVIFGTTREGEAMTLLHAHRACMSFNFGAGGVCRPERLISSWLLVGGHVPMDFRCPEMSFRVPGLQIWLSQKVINESHTKDESTGTYVFSYAIDGMKQETMEIPSEGFSLTWYHQCQSQTNPFTSIDVNISGWVTIRPTEPKQFDWFLEQWAKLSAILAFSSGSAMSPDCIKASSGRKYHDIYLLVSFGNKKYCEYKDLHDFFMSSGTMGDDLAHIVTRWFEIYPKVHMPCELALSILASERLWLHVEFLSLMQALEGFHRGLYEGLYMEEDQYESVKKALGDALPTELSSDHKDALRSRIRYGNQISLRKRLNALAELIPEQIRKTILGNNGKIPGSWVDTRNYYTHWDEELRPNVLDTQDMYNANVRMRVFLRVLYLNLMGAQEESILTALRNHSNDSQHLAQLNDRDIRKQGKENTGVILTISEQPTENETHEEEGKGHELL
jgi:hypothetical protein